MVTDLALPLGGLGLAMPALQNCPTDGTPSAGTAGQYNILVTDTGTAGTATESLTLNIYDVPKITSAPLVTLFAGQPASFTVNTTGYPVQATHAGLPSAAPTDPSKGNGMYFTTTGLPTSLTAGNLNELGYATGTLSIQGTPTTSDLGTHKVQITAANGVGSAAQQTLTLLVYPYSPTTPVNLLTSSVLNRRQRRRAHGLARRSGLPKMGYFLPNPSW